ncbi:MAG: hypothetical protein ABI680_20410, partial [Chthoniobacteraceae bacterium]
MRESCARARLALARHLSERFHDRRRNIGLKPHRSNDRISGEHHPVITTKHATNMKLLTPSIF